jgi:uncharacterized damage-inducible protein DinB
MPIIDSLLIEFDQEAQTTRRVLERIKDEHLNWRPHRKARTLGELALHIAWVPGAVAELAMNDKVQAPTFVDPVPNSTQEVLKTLDESIEKAKKTLAGVSDEVLLSSWSIFRGEQLLMSQPKLSVIRSIMLNHWYHHRGQLSVYLKELDIPIPSIYGPSADENPFA